MPFVFVASMGLGCAQRQAANPGPSPARAEFDRCIAPLDTLHRRSNALAQKCLADWKAASDKLTASVARMKALVDAGDEAKATATRLNGALDGERNEEAVQVAIDRWKEILAAEDVAQDIETARQELEKEEANDRQCLADVEVAESKIKSAMEGCGQMAHLQAQIDRNNEQLEELDDSRRRQAMANAMQGMGRAIAQPQPQPVHCFTQCDKFGTCNSTCQ